MKAIVCTRYGPPDVLQLREIEKPAPKRHEVLIKMRATSVTSSDCTIRGFEIRGPMAIPARLIIIGADTTSSDAASRTYGRPRHASARRTLDPIRMTELA